jgi:phage terminase large subunit
MEAVSKSEATILTNRARTDPAWWVRNVLGHEPWSKQVEILEAVRDNRETAVKSCHAAGKSFSAGDVALWFLYSHRPSIVITTAPTDRQVKGILWKEIRSSHQRARYPLGGDLLSQELKLDHDWWAWGFTAPEYDPDRFQGFHAIHILVVVDEASGVSQEIFDAIDGILTSDESRLLMIGNPTNPSGRFAKAFKRSDVAKISINAFDTPNLSTFGITQQDIESGTWEAKVTGSLPAPYLVTPRWVSDRLKEWGRDSALYCAKVEANFPQAGEDTLIPLHWIEAAVDRTLEQGAPKELGVDVARYGTDETVLVYRAGPVARIRKISPKNDTMQVAGWVIHEIRTSGARVAKIDAVGVGAGVYDRLKEQKKPVEEMQSGAAARDPERFANTRAEWWWYLRTLFETGEIDIEDDQVLINQLADMRFKVNSRGQILIESKDDMKKRGSGSPDRADALMLTFAPSRYIEGKRFPIGGATRRD